MPTTQARPGPAPAQTYRLIGRKTGRDKRVRHYFTVPERIAALLPEGVTFACELVEEGVLFRRVTETPPPPPPSWARTNNTRRSK